MNPDYRERIDKVIAYIKENCERKLTLDQLADVAGFSKYHFARIFAAAVGVTPAAYANRERLKKAVGLLSESNRTILDISDRCGFDSVSAFNAQFKKHYGQTPSEVRSGLRHHRNFPQQVRNNQAEPKSKEVYNHEENKLLKRAWDTLINIVDIPEREAACVRHVGSYIDTHTAWEKLVEWAGRQGLTPDHASFIGISLDDGNLVDELACRYDACVTLPEGFEKRGHPSHIAFRTLAGGLYAVYPYYDTVERFVLAYQTVFGLWLPNSGYEADDRPCLEWTKNDPATDPEGKCKVHLYVPIKKKE
ncbi:AraC family transcriptional regulator [Paenibacillus sp. LHD-117]|uniref:AraC family transcriptional regulator n=1 Tax=Paenibacillus sp. LHD-117 TaxID=3071412 RepID=UPI0027E07B6A|nr:AraC family transcriptional regulator [Paenibacillus sp. LHD-117]MDQ6419569.1 AraC family transcriptional regulator [Paenibacillus sp. LHD-117]